ncbi:MAG: FtsX-like permease family protein, partial [Treponema sp.]|nr:FtsX-like permease family protein [Treponema sp.]
MGIAGTEYLGGKGRPLSRPIKRVYRRNTETERLTGYTLALCNLRRKPFRTVCLIFLVSLLSFIGTLVGILWILAILVLAVVFSVIIAERRREFGIFRALGASRFRLVSLIVSESALISFWGALTGIFLSGLLILPFRVYISRIINMPFVQPSLVVLLCIAAASFLVSFFAGPLAS